MKNIFSSLHEKFRNKDLDMNDAQSYRDEAGNIVDNFQDQEHIMMTGSSAIQDAKYDKKNGDTTITFRGSDKEYVYPGVPEDTVKQWKKTPSKGRGFHRMIKQYSENA